MRLCLPLKGGGEFLWSSQGGKAGAILHNLVMGIHYHNYMLCNLASGCFSSARGKWRWRFPIFIGINSVNRLFASLCKKRDEEKQQQGGRRGSLQKYRASHEG